MLKLHHILVDCPSTSLKDSSVELVRIGLLSQSNCRVIWIDLLQHGNFPIRYRMILKASLCVSFYVYEDKLLCKIEFSLNSTRSITRFCWTSNILQNILHIQSECGEYSIEYCQSHITLLWIWIMLCLLVGSWPLFCIQQLPSLVSVGCTIDGSMEVWI